MQANAARPADSRALTERIWNAMPVTQQAFSKLLGLLDIEASTEVPSACVTLGARSRLLVNPDFVARHCATDAHLVVLVMHELFHIVLGHTRLYERATMAHNIAFDAVINSHLCLLFPDPGHTGLFRGLYRPDVFPEALLRPPDGWGTGRVRWRLKGRAGAVHRALYTESSATYAELLELLRDVLGEAGAGPAGTGSPGGEGAEQDGTVLLGNHGDEGEIIDPALLREVRGIVAEWPMEELRSGRDQGGDEQRNRIALRRARREAVGVIRRALLPLLDRGYGGRGPAQVDIGKVDAALPYRTQPDRRAEVRAALGQEPFLFQASLQAPTVERLDRAHVYVDVSGSMDGVLPLIYGALLPLKGYLHERIHLFSTEVRDIDPVQLARGEVSTTLGTDIDCVTGHMLEHGVRRAVLITDGWVGEVPSEHAARLRRRKARINGVVTYSGDPSFVAGLAGRAYRLPALNEYE